MTTLVLRHMQYSRKPARWDEVTHTIKRSLLPTLPVYNATELGVAFHPLADFRKPIDQQFFLVYFPKSEETFLVNTEGSNYCRYAARVVEN
jgi:hypothetical protein